ncbi:MAG TPA: hypothetical protein VG095_02745 [Chthoniobacterales bacterium]|nr:hypothetical protein [Chthoniobacterales bacterium]
MKHGIVFCLAASLIAALNCFAQSPAPNLTEMAAKLPELGAAGERKLEAGDTQGAIQDFQRATEWAEQLAKTYPQEPAYTENLFYYLDRLGAAYAAAGQVQDAINIQKPVAEGYRELATANPSGAAKNKAAVGFEHLAWYQLLNRDAPAALTSAQQATAIDPAAAAAKVKLAHALLLTGKVEDAKAIYQAERATVLPDGRTFEQAVLADLAHLERDGITDSRFADVRVLYGARQPGALGPVIVVVIVAGIFLLIALLIVWIFMRERKRTQKIEAVAKSLGFTFRKKPTPEDKTLLADSTLGRSGHGRSFSNVIEALAVQDARITIFDYSYASGTDERRSTTTQTVMRMQSPLLNLPAFVLRPESLLSKALKLVGFTDINFAEHPEFSRKYLLGGQDQEAVRRLFTPEIIAFCEQHPRIYIEGAGDRLIFYRQGIRQKPENLEAFLNEGKAVLALFVQASRAT